MKRTFGRGVLDYGVGGAAWARWLLSRGWTGGLPGTWGPWAWLDGGDSARGWWPGQFHDVVLAGEVAYGFPRDEESRRRLPAAVRLLQALSRRGLPVPVPVAAGHLDAPLGRCHAALARLPGGPLGALAGRAAEDAVAGQLAELLDRLAELGRDPVRSWLVVMPGRAHEGGRSAHGGCVR